MKQAKRMTKHGGQLPELLMAMVVGMIVAGTALQLLVGVWSETKRTYQQIEMLQETRLLQREWRHFASCCPSPLKQTAKGELAAGDSSVRFVSDEGLILTAKGRRRTLMLPRGMTAGLDVEISSQGTPLAVLTLQWSDREGDRVVNRRQRIVAANSRWGGES